MSVSTARTLFTQFVSPLHPTISMHILRTVLYTFPKVLTGRICLAITLFLGGDHFLYSSDHNV